MKIEGTIYIFAPLDLDITNRNREQLREHLIRPQAGRLFLGRTETTQWTIPFHNICHLVQILNEFHNYIGNGDNISYAVESGNYSKTFNIDNRRCIRIRIKDADPQTDPSKYSSYLSSNVQERVRRSEFSSRSIGMFVTLDTDEDYKYHKLYFTDFFDAGVKLNKIFSSQVAKRIPVEEQVNIPCNAEVDNV